jgi:hypothetical protein
MCKLMHKPAGRHDFSTISAATRLGTGVAQWTAKAPQQRGAVWWRKNDMKRLTSLGLAVLVAGAAACGVEPGDPGNDGGSAGAAGAGGGNNGGSGGGGGEVVFDPSDIQLNDVSVLFPLPATNKERDLGMLGVDAKGARGVLLPSSIYQAIGPVSGRTGEVLTGGTPQAAYADLHVVAMRIDPCFAELAPPESGEGCENQLRLVVQEVRDGSAFDSALHLFYSITRDELLDVVRAIGGLRQTLKPGEKLGKLQPHPLMVEQGLSGAMSKGVRDTILAHAGSENLFRVTRMSESNGPFWDFSGFDIAAGKAAPMTIPTLPSETQRQTFVRGFSADLMGSAEPPSGSEDDFMVLMNPTEAQALNETEREQKWAALLRVESASAHSPNTVDCVSCHVATPATKLVVEPLLGIESELPAELEATFENDDALTNIHAFSYLRTLVGINQRTVNESAAVVDYLLDQDF